MTVRSELTLLLTLVVCLALGRTARAQLSPGDLHKAHAFLDGVQNCDQCHGSKREVVHDKCLNCHKAIKARIDARTGMHGLQNYDECERCHVEHQGRESAFIYWKDGQKLFNHALTGLTLNGKHAALECRACHQSKFVVAKAELASDRMNLDSTFMGLDRACSSCHFDEHRAQMSTMCTNCHTTSAWKPATGFDHRKARFVLEGKHETVLCEKCHATIIDKSGAPDTSYVRFKPLVFAQCTDCHKDVHNGKLGPDCRNCHSTAGWHLTDKAKFDHSKTRYPLEGKHASVACDKCHSSGMTGKTLKFAACQDCHSDFHKGEFAKRQSKGACEECHSVQGYSPARFIMAQHDSTDFPLKEAHRAVPCVACHSYRDSATSSATFRFAFTNTQCLTCHRDQHRGELVKLLKNRCEYCHSETNWKQVTFDHNLTEFRLEGKHIGVVCYKCHTGTINGEDKPGLTFVGARKECDNCHKDIHKEQFLRQREKTTVCTRCHTVAGWKSASFDHNKVSRFKLDGAHIKVPCVKCHIPKTIDGELFTLYKPLDTACASCHGTTTQNPKEKKS